MSGETLFPELENEIKELRRLRRESRGEFLMLYDFFDLDKLKKLLTLNNDELTRAFLAKSILDFLQGFSISKKLYKRELAEYLKEKGVSKDDILKLSNLSKRTLHRMKIS